MGLIERRIRTTRGQQAPARRNTGKTDQKRGK
jgi:hypothetical protein